MNAASMSSVQSAKKNSNCHLTTREHVISPDQIGVQTDSNKDAVEEKTSETSDILSKTPTPDHIIEASKKEDETPVLTTKDSTPDYICESFDEIQESLAELEDEARKGSVLLDERRASNFLVDLRRPTIVVDKLLSSDGSNTVSGEAGSSLQSPQDEDDTRLSPNVDQPESDIRLSDKVDSGCALGNEMSTATFLSDDTEASTSSFLGESGTDLLNLEDGVKEIRFAEDVEEYHLADDDEMQAEDSAEMLVSSVIESCIEAAAQGPDHEDVTES